ncbi:MAG TPA: hypothetical protein VIX91_21870 [Candidatus Acidoferrum sp.]
MALSNSILEAARQWSAGGCTAFADEHGSAKIAALTASDLATAVLFVSVHHRPLFIGSSSPKARHIRSIKAVNDTSGQCKAGDI